MAPRAIEPELRRGRWLVLLFAVWSAPDIGAIRIAVSVAEQFQEALRVGVRPFDDHAETSAWCPAVTERSGSPVWLLLREGHLQRELVGLRSQAELVQWIGDLSA